MKAKILPSDVLEPFDRPLVPQYETVQGELASIRSGSKAMSAFEWSLDDFDSDPEYLELIHLALEYDLTVIHKIMESGDPARRCRVFVLHRAEDQWRVQAFLLLKETFKISSYRWSLELEGLTSRLLGYSEEQIHDWEAYEKAQNIGWTGRTIYIIVDENQRALLREHGDRCFPLSLRHQVIDAFSAIGGYRVRGIADDLLRSSRMSLGRLAIASSLYAEIFPNMRISGERGILVGQLTLEPIAHINARIVHGIEFWGPDAWGA